MQHLHEYQRYEGALRVSDRDFAAACGRYPGMDKEIVIELDPGPLAAADARTALALLEGRVGYGLLEDVRLLVSELVTNSVRHAVRDGHGNVRLEVGLAEGTLRVEVADQGAGFEPRPRFVGQRQDSGRGLYLVDRLADRWGVVREPGTRVWFEIDGTAAG
jgi:anti-sigma regulatory factor (Ser/Thr protein kinase)